MDTKAFVQDTVSRSLDKYLELHPDGGVPAGGTTGQALVKASDADGDVEWTDTMTQDALDNRTLTPTGWGVAKVINDQVSGSSEYVDKSYDISDLRFTNADDYTVSAIAIGGASGYGGSTKFYIKEGTKTATGFELRIDKSTGSTVKYQVTIIGKGYGGTHFVDGTGLPVGGEDGQILTKIGNEDGVVDWGFDTGAYLAKYGRKYGLAPAQTTAYVRVQTAYTSSPTNPYPNDLKDSCRRFRIPIGGQLQNVDSILDGGLLSTYDLYVTFTGYQGERKVLSSFSRKANGYYTAQVDGSDRRLFLCQATSTVEGGDILLDVVVADPNRWTQNNGVTQLRFVARDGYDFGISGDLEPYDMRNLTGMVLDDLKVTGTAVPTDWGIATKGLIQIPNNGTEYGRSTIDVSGFGFENADDYSVSLAIVSGAGGYGGVNTYIPIKTATEFAIHWARVSGGTATRVDYEYTIFAKGYGNNTMSAPNAVLESPNGTKYKLKVADDGTLSTEAV